jgi:tryptophanyl-tRNA synthetase
MVADWHALMSEYQNPSQIKRTVIDNVCDWLSCGINPDKSIIFLQSDVKEHLELHLILSIITPLGWLERCPTYKEQLKELASRDIKTYGFLGYPVLQAADILIYKADCVPVGEDQLPHLELTREIVPRFYSLYQKKIFPEPQPLISSTPKLLGIDNRKMSKSYENYIRLSDSKRVIKEKVKMMITDPKRVRLTDKGHPHVCNVYSYYRIFKPEVKTEVYDWCRNASLGCRECKQRLGDILVDNLSDIHNRRKELLKNTDKIHDILQKGACRAKRIALETMEEVKRVVGL